MTSQASWLATRASAGFFAYPLPTPVATVDQNRNDASHSTYFAALSPGDILYRNGEVVMLLLVRQRGTPAKTCL